jgi:hypothetical protein
LDALRFNEVVARLKEVNDVVSKLDESIRAEGFALLRPYIVGAGSKSVQTGNTEPDATPPADTTDAEAFFTAHPEGKPSDNLVLSAAYLYSQYGTEPFSLDDLRDIAHNTGLTIPASPIMTLKAKRKGKALFQRIGQNKYRPTVHGEAYFKATLGVQKGTKKRPSGDE